MLRPSRIVFVAPAVLATSLALPALAGAQTSTDNDRRARIEYAQGSEAFTRGDYAAAIRHFEAAYELSQRPQLLYNIGTSHDRLHQWREAQRAFERYLEALPNASNAAEVRARLRVIQSEIEREQRLAAARNQPVVIVRERPGRVVVHTAPPRTWLWVAGIGGGLTVIAGGIALTMGLLTNAYYDGLREQCGQTGCPEASIQDVALRATLTNVAIGATIGFGVASVTALVLDQTRPQRAVSAPALRASFAPTLSPLGALTGGSLVFTGVL